jgi:GNAT superfamily N-acetyltransferase
MSDAPAIHVRTAHAADLESLAAFNAAMAIETENKTLAPQTLRAGVARVFAEPTRGFYLVAECDGSVAGCLMVTFEWSDWRNGDWWWLQSVYVVPAFRRRGVFRALYEEVERRIKARKDVIGLRLYVERDNVTAHKTYEQLGIHMTRYQLREAEYARSQAKT